MEIKPGQSPVGSALTAALAEQTASAQVGTDLSDSLLSNVSVRGLPPELLRPQVIEAVVLRNTLLPAGTGTSAAPAAGNPLSPLLTGSPQTSAATVPAPPQALPLQARPVVPLPLLSPLLTTPAATAPAPNAVAPLPTTLPQAATTAVRLNLPLLQVALAATAPSTAVYRAALQWQGKTFNVITAQPLPRNIPLQIQVGPRNELILRNTELAVKTAALTSPQRLAASSAPVAPVSTAPLSARERVLQAIQPLVRENLPRQQPLRELLPALRALIAPEQLAKLPPPLARALVNLWRALPTPAQVQQPAALKQVLHDSGHFFEANLAAARTGSQPDAVPRILVTDLKAQLIVLATLLRSRPNPTVPPPAETPPPGTATTATATAPTTAGMHASASTPAQTSGHADVYSRPAMRPEAMTPAQRSHEETLDNLLQTLGKTLEAGLARIHLNQLDSVLSRHSGADPTQNIPTWVLELPVQTARGRDQFTVRIEQHARKQDQKRYKQWLVQLGFDLHEHGKLAATLSIVERSVAATLWAEHEQTHRTVQREMQSLRSGLEAAGVKVTEMQCRLGIPPERNELLSQRLVDIHS